MKKKKLQLILSKNKLFEVIWERDITEKEEEWIKDRKPSIIWRKK
jgi:hypothetical protein